MGRSKIDPQPFLMHEHMKKAYLERASCRSGQRKNMVKQGLFRPILPISSAKFRIQASLVSQHLQTRPLGFHTQ